MKIEKLTENKIRILLKYEDIKEKNIDLHTIMTKAIESQGFFLELLDQAERQLGFNTDGCRLLIEAYSSADNDFVFTITKYLEDVDDFKPIPRKKVVPRRKSVTARAKCIVFSFADFDAFCELCTCLNSSNFSVRGLARSVSLVEFKGSYFLVIDGLNFNKISCKSLLSVFSEFGRFVSASSAFQNKLFEHGKIIMKHNALNTGIKFFA